ncbi:MAG: hypothetical protein HYV13_01150 [Candidatus Doudnabacteria bacterium]|nr:hypothetical protein [Candidatus Doudnabacteria bacterium]
MSETTWQFYTDAPSALEAMFSDCQNAAGSIDLDQYIFHFDEIGKKFVDLFLRKAKDGVRVRMILDTVGSRDFYSSDVARTLSEAGIQVFFFNPISPWRLHNFTSWFFRDHKKILVVDGKIGHTGGLGISGAMSTWRDTNVRVTGPIVHEMERVFARMLEIARKRRFTVIQNLNSNFSEFKFLASSPYLRTFRSFKYRKRYLRDAFIQAVRNAKNYIYLTTPYFVPDLRFFSSLRKAAKRGVDVRLLVPVTSDHLSLDMAAASYFGLALAAGIRIFRYQGSLLHAKTGVVDGRWGTVGSANLDNLSFWFCYEANIISSSLEFNARLKQQFLSDLQMAKEIKLFEWVKRPLKQKFLELLTWPAHNFM